MADNIEHWQVGQHLAHAWLRPDGTWMLDLPPDPATWPAVIAERPRRVTRLLPER